MHKALERAFGWLYHPILGRMRKARRTRLIKKEVARKVAAGSLVSQERRERPRIYVDVTGVFINDRGTGIQRVTREVSRRLKEVSKGYDVVDVWCGGSSYLTCEGKSEIGFRRGDVFFVLDQSLENVCNNAALFKYLAADGVRVAAFFYDMLPVTHPEFFWKGLPGEFGRYFRTVLHFSQIICDSRAVADELEAYLSAHPEVKRNPNLEISHSLLGCDFSVPKDGGGGTAFLLVSTVEPRKMYGQALAAFDLLWKEGADVRLWIVGRPGWKNKKTIAAIEHHPELGKRLQWYRTGIGDEELASLYRRCDAVLFASLAEGFGLAVAEGAHFGKPLILRDIPVFREIAGENAFYFSGEGAEGLAAKIKEWLALYKEGLEPKPDGIRLPTWEGCASRIFGLLSEG